MRRRAPLRAAAGWAGVVAVAGLAPGILDRIDDRLDASLQGPGVRPWLEIATHAGDLQVLAAAVGTAGYRWTRRGEPGAVVALLASFGLAEAIVWSTRPLVRRPRPAGDVPLPMGSSFPSAHAAASASVYLAMGLLLRGASERPRSSQVAVPAAGALCAAVAASRVTIRVHRSTDVIAGTAVGIVAARWSVGIHGKRSGRRDGGGGPRSRRRTAPTESVGAVRDGGAGGIRTPEGG